MQPARPGTAERPGVDEPDSPAGPSPWEPADGPSAERPSDAGPLV